MSEKELTIITQDNSHYIDSREVAEIVGKRHDHLIRDINNYIKTIEKITAPNFGVSEFFLVNTYKDSTGRTLPCYLLTKMGCEMVANKLTGEKGVLFTAMYVKKFNDMENQERKLIPAPTTPQLKEYNKAANLIVGVLKPANVPADKIAVTVKHIYELSGITVLLDGMNKNPGYSAMDIARICGVLSLNENPHYQAVNAIITMLKINDGHKTYVPRFYGSDIKVSVRYDEHVINLVNEWLVRRDYPDIIQHGMKKYQILYEEC